MSNMNRTLKIALYWVGVCGVVFVAGLSAVPVHATSHHNLFEPLELERFVDGVMADHLNDYRIPGATLAVVRDGELLFTKGYGYADRELRTQVDPARTLFRIGSVSKLFTWTAVMQLVEQGLLDLHTDVNTYLDFTIPATFSEPITLAHLMTHTAGFEELDMGLFVLSEEDMYPLGVYVQQRLPKRIYPTGEVSAYSNYGTALAGYIVERIAGESFEAYADRHILVPLGMERSTFRQPLPPELAGDLARGYGFHNSQYIRGDFEFIVGYPVGSMSATATDMAAFMIAHLQEGQYGDTAILQPATAQEMHRRQYTADPRLHGMVYGFWERRVNGRRIIFHNGDTFLYHAALYLLPEENLGIFVAYSGDIRSQAADKLLRAFMDHYYPAPFLAELSPPAGAAARIAAFTGEYHMARSNDSTVEKVIRILGTAQVNTSPEDELLLTMGNTERYTEIGPGIFRHRLRDELLIFQPGRDGTTWLTLDGNAPVTMFRAPWYATSTVTGFVLVLTILSFVASTMGWLIWTLRAWRRGSGQPFAAQIARGLAVSFGFIFIIFLLGFLGVMGDIEPAYDTPRVYFGAVSVLNIVLMLPWLLAVMLVGLLIFTLFIWIGTGNAGRPYWNLPGRLHYTVLTLVASAAMGSLWYWNFLTGPL